jgi:hypothetical protein
MRETVYVLCALTSLACAVLLLRGYVRTRARLLLWSCVCFFALTANNVLLFIDRVILPDVDRVWGLHFQVWRSIVSAIGMFIILVGLIWDSDREAR